MTLAEIASLTVPETKRKKKKVAKTPVYRKAPQAPKRFKSSYICFSMAKREKIKAELGGAAKVTEVAEEIARQWRALVPDERAIWDEAADRDKERFAAEKSRYTGPWQVPLRRKKKDPSAPKRPMSAFLYYSQKMRPIVKKQHPNISNTDVSKLLGEMWNKASDDEKAPHIHCAATKREQYNMDVSEWRKEQERLQVTEIEDDAAKSDDDHTSSTSQSWGCPNLTHENEHDHFSGDRRKYGHSYSRSHHDSEYYHDPEPHQYYQTPPSYYDSPASQPPHYTISNHCAPPPSYPPMDTPPRYAPMDTPPNYAAADTSPRYAPMDSPPRYTPVDSSPRYAPVDSSPRYAPADSRPRYAHPDPSPRYVPAEYPTRYAPVDSPQRYAPAESPPRYTQTDAPPNYGSSGYGGYQGAVMMSPQYNYPSYQYPNTQMGDQTTNGHAPPL